MINEKQEIPDASGALTQEALQHMADEFSVALSQRIVEDLQAGSDVKKLLEEYPLLAQALRPSLREVVGAKPDDTQKIAASLMELTSSYYESARQQSQRNFVFSIAAATVGLGFFIAAYFTNQTLLSLGSGAFLETLSALVFTLYTRTSYQLSVFLKSMETTQRYLIANSICENLPNNEKQKARQELIRKIADISRNQHLTSSGWGASSQPEG